MEFLVRIIIDASDVGAEDLSALISRERERARELAGMGIIRRLWRTSPEWGNWGLWECHDRGQLDDALGSLPLRPHMTVQIYPLEPHPSDPASAG